MNKTMAEQVEEWLDKAPKGLIVFMDEVLQEQKNVWTHGSIVPLISKGNYVGTISFRTKSWKENDM